MHKVAESSSFQELESRSKIDLKDILSKAYTQETRLLSAEEKAKNMSAQQHQELKQAISQLLAANNSAPGGNGSGLRFGEPYDVVATAASRIQERDGECRVETAVNAQHPRCGYED